MPLRKNWRKWAKEFGGLMAEAPKGMYIVERHTLEEVA